MVSAHWHRSGGQIRFADKLDVRQAGLQAREKDGLVELSQGGGGDDALNLSQVSLGMLKTWIGEALDERTIVGQEEKPLAVEIQPACRVYTRH